MRHTFPLNLSEQSIEEALRQHRISDADKDRVLTRFRLAILSDVQTRSSLLESVADSMLNFRDSTSRVLR